MLLQPFSDCARLSSIIVDAGNPVYSSLGGVLFNKSQTVLIRCPEGKVWNYTIPDSVTNIGDVAFFSCDNLTGIYFYGNAPGSGWSVFSGASRAKVYRLPSTKGWGETFASLSALPWEPQIKAGNRNPDQNGHFGFDITYANGMVVVIEACTNLNSGVWFPIQTNTLAGDTIHFSDLQSTNYPGRFYRLRTP